MIFFKTYPIFGKLFKPTTLYLSKFLRPNHTQRIEGLLYIYLYNPISFTWKRVIFYIFPGVGWRGRYAKNMCTSKKISKSWAQFFFKIRMSMFVIINHKVKIGNAYFLHLNLYSHGKLFIKRLCGKWNNIWYFHTYVPRNSWHTLSERILIS